LLAIMATNVFSQEAGKVRGGFNIGPCLVKGLGVALDFQIGYNLEDNMNVGFQLGLALMAKVDPDGNVGSIAGNVNYLGTFTYFLGSGAFAPFIGSKLGIYGLAAGSIGDNWAAAEAGNKFGGALTAGFEIKRIRLAAEYNMLSSTTAEWIGIGEAPKGSKSISNSYAALTFGFYFGGGSRGGK